MAESDPDRLSRLLEQRADAAVQLAIETGGDVPQDELDRIGRLARLIELRDSAAPRPTRQVWPIVAIALATVIVVSILLFAEVRETEIELDVIASDIGFTLPSRQVLLETVGLTTIGVSGLARIDLPEPLDALLDQGAGGEAGESAVRLSAVRAESGAGSISIGSIIPAEGTDVWLGEGDLPGQYRLSMRNPQVEIQIDVLGAIQVSLAGAEPRVHQFSSPRAITLRPSEGVVDMDLEFVDAARPGVTPQVPIRSLGFSRVNEFADRGVSIVRQLSTIQSGTLYLESLNGQARPLRAGESLRFEQSDGELRRIGLEKGHLSITFHGRVRGMATGSQASPRGLMPTWLEWLMARHGLSLFWGTTGYLFGLALAVVRWFRGPI